MEETIENETSVRLKNCRGVELAQCSQVYLYDCDAVWVRQGSHVLVIEVRDLRTRDCIDAVSDGTRWKVIASSYIERTENVVFGDQVAT